MAQSLSQLYVHVVWSTKRRAGTLDDAWRDELHRVMAGLLHRMECGLVEAGSVADHVHLLVRQSRTVAIAEVVKEVKLGTGHWIRDRDPHLAAFRWQAGYGAFTLSASNVEAVRAYIRGQADRHRIVTFKDEFRALLQRHAVKWDERHVWD